MQVWTVDVKINVAQVVSLMFDPLFFPVVSNTVNGVSGFYYSCHLYHHVLSY